MTEEEKLQAIWKAAEDGTPLPDGVYVHVTHAPTQADWDALDPKSWETSCADCGEYYSGTYGDPLEETEFMCPSCSSTRTTGVASPAGAMGLLYRSEI